MTSETIFIFSENTELTSELKNKLPPSSTFRVISAVHAEETLAQIHQNTVKFVLADLNVKPVFEVILKIQSAVPNVPIILLCAKDQESVPLKVLSLGIRNYLQYPFDEAEIAALLLSLDHTEPDNNYGNLVKELTAFNTTLEQRIKEATVLQGIGRSVNIMLDLDAVLNRVVEAATFVSNAEEGYLMLLDEESDELLLRAAKNMGERRAQVTRLKTNDTIAGTVVQSGKPIILRGNADRRFKVKTGYLVHSLINVPLKINDRVIGILGVDNPTGSTPFTMDDLRRLTALAANAATALENARIYEKVSKTLTKRIEELDSLQSLTRDLNATTDQELIAQLILSRTLKATKADVSVLGWIGSDKPMWVSQGALPYQIVSSRHIKDSPWWDQKMLDQVMQNGKPNLESDISHEGNGSNSPNTDYTQPKLCSRLAVPINYGNTAVGVINLESAAPYAFNNNDLRLVHAIADQAATALHNAAALKQIERNQIQLSLIMKHISDAVWLVDTHLNTLKINEAACTLLGRQAEDIIGIPFSDAWINETDSEHKKIAQYLEQSIAQATEVPFPNEIKIVDENGHITKIEGTAYPLSNQKQILGAALVFRQVSPLRETERLQADFISMASHNLRTPLMSVQASLDYILETPVDPAKTKRLLNDARTQSQKIASFLRELLDISQLASGQEIPIRIRPVNFLPLLHAVIEDFQTSTPDTRFNLKLPPVLPLVSADELKLEIILRNLLNYAKRRSNAVDPVDIEVEEKDQEIVVSIIDHGPAISPIQYEQIFWHVYTMEPDKDSETMPYGYAIGLFTTRRLVELMGGSIWVTESNAHGACIKFTLSIWR